MDPNRVTPTAVTVLISLVMATVLASWGNAAAIVGVLAALGLTFAVLSIRGRVTRTPDQV